MMPMNGTYHTRRSQLSLQLRLTLLNQSGYCCFNTPPLTDRRRKANLPALLAFKRLEGVRGGGSERGQAVRRGGDVGEIKWSWWTSEICPLAAEGGRAAFFSGEGGEGPGVMVTWKPDDLEHPQGENGSYCTYAYGVTSI